jgi:hypothetical protein
LPHLWLERSGIDGAASGNAVKIDGTFKNERVPFPQGKGMFARMVRADFAQLMQRANWHAVRHATRGEWDKVQIHIDQAEIFRRLAA